MDNLTTEPFSRPLEQLLLPASAAAAGVAPADLELTASEEVTPVRQVLPVSAQQLASVSVRTTSGVSTSVGLASLQNDKYGICTNMEKVSPAAGETVSFEDARGSDQALRDLQAHNMHLTCCQAFLVQLAAADQQFDQLDCESEAH